MADVGEEQQSMTGDKIVLKEFILYLETMPELWNSAHTQLDLTKWLQGVSCNGRTSGVCPTVLFALASIVFLCHEIDDVLPRHRSMLRLRPPLIWLERGLLGAIVPSLLMLMINLWICVARFLQCYFEAILEQYPVMLFEMMSFAICGTGGCKIDPVNKFLRTQHYLVHLTACWLMAFAWAEYVRINYCQSFALPLLDRWHANHANINFTIMDTVSLNILNMGSMLDRANLSISRLAEDMSRGLRNQLAVWTGQGPRDVDTATSFS